MNSPNYRLEFSSGLVMDDTLWQQAIGVERHFIEHRLARVTSWSHDEQRLSRLLHMGVQDARGEDRPMDASTRSMRYSAVLADRLWSMVEAERDRVRIDVIQLS